ncbi:hypothetical protein SERLADRAFT_473800, partial [Serpula lacrymans var. lacrymans S7.9]
MSQESPHSEPSASKTQDSKPNITPPRPPNLTSREVKSTPLAKSTHTSQRYSDQNVMLKERATRDQKMMEELVHHELHDAHFESKKVMEHLCPADDGVTHNVLEELREQGIFSDQGFNFDQENWPQPTAGESAYYLPFTKLL